MLKIVYPENLVLFGYSENELRRLDNLGSNICLKPATAKH